MSAAPPGWWEQTWQRWADRHGAKRPAPVSKWDAVREAVKGRWLTYDELAVAAGSTNDCARQQVTHHPDLWEKRSTKAGKVAVRVR